MDKMFDVIVVGAGNGGLAAAANTAKEGLKTLLLEKHNIPGGCATSFRRGRFEFKPSLHELCSVGTAEKPNIVYKIFDDLGTKINWEYEKGHIFRTIAKGENGFDARLNAGIEDFVKSMEGIYTTSVNQSTLDESPFAYKPLEAILENINETVEVLEIIKPIYNFKASDNRATDDKE